MEKEQREIIKKWLKQGFIDWEELYLLNPSKEETDLEEIIFQNHRWANNFQWDYCPLMKVSGKCPHYDPDNCVRFWNDAKVDDGKPHRRYSLEKRRYLDEPPAE